MGPVVAVVPLKAIATSKTRMAPALSPADRALLLRRTFGRVMAACAEAARVSEVVVVAGDAQGRDWAREEGAAVLDEPEPPAGGLDAALAGLNAALAGADRLLGRRPTLVVPADLPLATGEDLDAVVAAAPAVRSVVIAPTADGGTGALLRAPGGVIAPAYGPGSARAHQLAAARAGVAVRVVALPGLALDLDRPTDIVLAGGWSALTGRPGAGETSSGGYPAA